MLVDSSTTALKHARVALEFEGFAVSEAHDAASAVAASAEDPPDLVIAAVGLPGRSGYDLCRELRASPATAGVQVLLTFSALDVYDPARAERAGAAGVLAKPFLPSHLLSRVAEVLGDADLRSRSEPPAPLSAEDLPSLDTAAVEAIGPAAPRFDAPEPFLPRPAEGAVPPLRDPSSTTELPAGFVQPLEDWTPLRIETSVRRQVEEVVDRRLESMLAPGGALRAAIDMALERLVRDRVEARFAEVLDRVVRERSGQGGPAEGT